MKVETLPPLAEIEGLAQRAIAADRAGIADRNDVVEPILRQRLDLAHHLLCREIGARFEFALDAVLAGHHLDVGSADVDRENGSVHLAGAC